MDVDIVASWENKQTKKKKTTLNEIVSNLSYHHGANKRRGVHEMRVACF